MDTEIILIAAILVALCAFPIVYFMTQGKKKMKNLKKGLEVVAQNAGCEITNSDGSGKVAIGMDERKEKIFFYRDEDKAGSSAEVDLAQVKNCQIRKEWSPSESGAATNGSLNRLLLLFTMKSTSQNTITFSFYDYEKDWQMADQSIIAEKWMTIINSKIR